MSASLPAPTGAQKPFLKCLTCHHWTKKGKLRGPRLCRHPEKLLTTQWHNDTDTVVLLHTGPNCICDLHDDPVVALEPGDPVYYDASDGSHVKVGEVQKADPGSGSHDPTNNDCPWNDPETALHPMTRGLPCTCPAQTVKAREAVHPLLAIDGPPIAAGPVGGDDQQTNEPPNDEPEEAETEGSHGEV